MPAQYYTEEEARFTHLSVTGTQRTWLLPFWITLHIDSLEFSSFTQNLCRTSGIGKLPKIKQSLIVAINEIESGTYYYRKTQRWPKKLVKNSENTFSSERGGVFLTLAKRANYHYNAAVNVEKELLTVENLLSIFEEWV